MTGLEANYGADPLQSDLPKRCPAGVNCGVCQWCVDGPPEPRLSNKVVLVCSEHGRITEHIAISETPRCVTNHRQAGCWEQITMRTVKSNGSH